MGRKNKPIHIWTPGIRDDTGGIQAFSRFFVRAVRDGFPEHPIRVFVKNERPKADDELLHGGIEIHSLENVPARIRTLGMAGVGLTQGIRERPACSLSTHLHFLPALKLLRQISGARYAGVLHGIEAWRLQSRHRIHALRDADRLIAVSHFTRRRVIEDCGVDENRICVVPNTFDGARFSPGPKPSHLLERYGLRHDQPVMLTVSRLALSERYKGHWQVLLALKKICETKPETHYLIGGTGDEITHLRNAVKTMRLESNVTFAGFISSEELPDHYRLCDVFVMPSTKEGFGIVFLEAAASGKPVIAGDLDGSVDALDNGRLGILADPHDPHAIAAAVLSALDKTHPNTLLFKPDELSRAVRETFGFTRMSEMLRNEVSLLLSDKMGAKTISPPPSSLSQKSAGTVGMNEDRAPRIVILTQLNSPYQVEFFNSVALHGGCHIEVIYLTNRDRGRQWVSPDIAHSHIILSETPHLKPNALESIGAADLVIFNYYTESFAWQAIRKRAATQKPWVFWGERPGFLQLGRPARWFRRVALNRLHGGRAPIWAVGRFGIEGYQREFGDHRTYQNVPYYSNLERFSHRSRQTNSRRIVLFSGSLIERKGADLLASAFSKVADECQNLHLRFMGAGDLAESLQSELIKHAGRVEWLGFQPWDRLPEHYAAADLFCMPSRYDGWGLALVEALASGLPSISTTMTGAALELVENGKNGWLIPGEDEQALVNALREASRLSDPELQSMQEAARNSVVNHTLSRGADHFIHCAKEAIKHWQIHPSGNQSAH